MAANRAPATGPWRVGVERPGQLGEARLMLDFERGGLATSGDTHRFIEHEGRRYSHILDVRTRISRRRSAAFGDRCRQLLPGGRHDRHAVNAEGMPAPKRF